MIDFKILDTIGTVKSHYERGSYGTNHTKIRVIRPIVFNAVLGSSSYHHVFRFLERKNIGGKTRRASTDE